MPGINLTQEEADALIAMRKRAVESIERLYPRPGDQFSAELTSEDGKEQFMLDVNRARVKVTKATYQNRARKVVVLVRLDIDGSRHRNPDQVFVPCPHMHIYREGHGDQWAFPLRDLEFPFPDTTDLTQLLRAFMLYCNIVVPPVFRPTLEGLFP
jgi:hypothetical protein